MKSNINFFAKIICRTSLVVQWFRFPASNAGDASSIPGRGTRIPYAMVQPKNKPTAETKSRVNKVWEVTEFLPSISAEFYISVQLVRFRI